MNEWMNEYQYFERADAVTDTRYIILNVSPISVFLRPQYVSMQTDRILLHYMHIPLKMTGVN
jgi:hypothetical protein